MLPSLIDRVLDYAEDYLRREPVRAAGIITAAIVSAAGALSIVVDQQSLGELVAQALVILGFAEGARTQAVSPKTHEEEVRKAQRRR